MNRNENLGREATDKITQFKGVVTGHCQYLTGCDQYLLIPLSVDNSKNEGHWFDDSRLNFGKVKFNDTNLEPITGDGADMAAPKTS